VAFDLARFYQGQWLMIAAASTIDLDTNLNQSALVLGVFF